jgi:hypothetical protein
MTRPNDQITDAVSIHSLKKIQYAKRLAAGNFGNVSLLDHFVSVCLFSILIKFVLILSTDLRRSIVGKVC